MNVAQCIEDLITIKAAADNPNQGTPSLQYQQDRLRRARERLHAAFGEQIRECVRDMTQQLQELTQ